MAIKPPTPVKRYHESLIQTMRDIGYHQKWFTSPINLGGVTGEDGGSGIPIGGLIGQLIQSKVAYDTTEASSLTVPPSGQSLVHNLNRIRYWITDRSPKIVVLDEGVEIASGVRELDFIGAPVTVTMASGYSDRVAISISGTGGGGGEIVKVSSDDTTANYLENKLTAGSAKIAVTTINPGANEERQVDFGTVGIADLSDVTEAGATQGKVLTYDGADWFPSGVSGGTGSGIAGVDIEEAGAGKVTDATILNFVSGATIVDAGGGQADITVSGGAGVFSYFQEDVSSQVPAGGDNYTLTHTPASGSLVVHLNGVTQQYNNYNLTTSGFHTTFTATTGDELITEYFHTETQVGVTGPPLEVKDDGASVNTSVTILNIQGMTVTDDGGGQVTISGGTGSGGGAADTSIWMPDAPPGTAYSANGTDDDEFDDSSFDTGIWTEFDPGSNQTVAEQEYGLTLINTAGNDNVQGIFQPVPSGVTDWSFTTYVGVPWDRDNGHRAGILLIEDISDLPNTDCFLFANYRGSAGFGWQGIYMTDYNSWSADDYNEVNVNSTPFSQYLRFRSDGSDWHFDWSVDGKSWISEQYVDSSPTRFTAEGIGLGTKFDNSSQVAVFPFARFKADFAKTQVLYGDRIDLWRTT